jgi:hypothetical protein
MLSSAQTPTEGKIMTLVLAIAFNALLMVALVGTLFVVMSRAARLKPHFSAAVVPAFAPAPAGRTAWAHRGRRPNGALAVVRS